MSWTGIATDLTLDDVIGPPRELAPTPQPAQQHRPAATQQATQAQPDVIRYRAPAASAAPARSQPHVHVTEDMLPPAMRARLPGGRRSNMPWVAGAVALSVVAVVAASLATSTPRTQDEQPARSPAQAYEPSAPAAPPAVRADDADPVAAIGRPKVSTKARQVHVRPKSDAPAADVPNEAVGDDAGDIGIEKFRQLSGKI